MSQVTLTYSFMSAAAAAAFADHAAKFLAIPGSADIGNVLGGTVVKEAAAASGKSADKKESKAKPAETPSTASPAPVASATPAPESKPPATESAKPVEYKDTGIGELIQQMVQAKGKEPVVALLSKYGAKKGGELKSEQFSAFKAEIEGLLNPAAADDLS